MDGVHVRHSAKPTGAEPTFSPTNALSVAFGSEDEPAQRLDYVFSAGGPAPTDFRVSESAPTLDSGSLPCSDHFAATAAFNVSGPAAAEGGWNRGLARRNARYGVGSGVGLAFALAATVLSRRGRRASAALELAEVPVPEDEESGEEPRSSLLSETRR